MSAMRHARWLKRAGCSEDMSAARLLRLRRLRPARRRARRSDIMMVMMSAGRPASAASLGAQAQAQTASWRVHAEPLRTPSPSQ
eukprot:649093-Rhodomonas_salina.2